LVGILQLVGSVEVIGLYAAESEGIHHDVAGIKGVLRRREYWEGGSIEKEEQLNVSSQALTVFLRRLA
jgi:hypothetical protein